MITFCLFSCTFFFSIMVFSTLADEPNWQFINNGPLYVVTSFPELPTFYSELRIQNPQIITTLTPPMKDDICYRTHHHFDPTIEWLRPENHQNELREDNSGVFEELFEVVERDTLPTELSSPDDATDNDHQQNDEQPINEPLPFQLSEDDDDTQGSQCTSVLSTDRDEGPTFRYTNSSRYRRFLIDEEVGDAAEFTFICLVRHLRTGEIQPYYVSDFAYDVNDATGKRLEGRFIFYDNRVRAIAEVQPIQRGADIFEVVTEAAYYAERHRGRVPTTYAKDDPVCGLDNGRKLRLCTYICMYHMPAGCQTQVVVDEECKMERFFLGNLWYHEWALGCNVRNENHYFQRKVSHGYRDNEAFVFTVDDNGRISSRYSLVGVSVIIDSGANN